MRRKILLGLVSLFLLSPIISFSIRTAMAAGEDSLGDTSVTGVGQPVGETDKPGYRPLVYTMVIQGAIGVVTADRIDEAVEIAELNDAELLVVLLDTPGGFMESTWSINKILLNSRVPVCVYVYPSGARSGSAGVYMTYAANFAAMAPSTNIGAAHPVSGDGKEIDSVMNEKVTNDAVAQIKASAQKRGRNVEWAEKAVRESVSITDVEALEMNVIDLRAEDIDDLLSQLQGRQTEVPGGMKTMNLTDARIEELKSSFVQRVLQVITDPSIVFILFSLGGLGIILELYNPGSILPGVVGAICLILAFYAAQSLPINYAGVALLLLAVVLFIAEIKIVSHGLLTVGGVIALFLGGLMLIDTVDPALQVSKSVLVTVVLLVGGLVAVVLWLVLKASRRQPFTGNEGMIGKIAEVRANDFVYVDGALWKLHCDEPLEVGNKVEVIAVDKLTLIVKRTQA